MNRCLPFLAGAALAGCPQSVGLDPAPSPADSDCLRASFTSTDEDPGSPSVLLSMEVPTWCVGVTARISLDAEVVLDIGPSRSAELVVKSGGVRCDVPVIGLSVDEPDEGGTTSLTTGVVGTCLLSDSLELVLEHEHGNWQVFRTVTEGTVTATP